MACYTGGRMGEVSLNSATSQPLPDGSAALIVTDPPYYDLVPYADLSDFFFVWLKRSTANTFAELFEASLSPNLGEAVQLAERNVDYAYKTKDYYESLMTKSMVECRRVLDPRGLAVIFFAHKGTGAWESQLQAMIDAGWTILASWPIDTEAATRMRARNSAV